MTMIWSVEFTQEDAVAIERAAEARGYEGAEKATNFINDVVLAAAIDPAITAPTWHTFPPEDLATLVFMVAGGAAGEVMRLAPEVVMPTEAISETVCRIMKDQGHDISDVPGYAPNKGTSILKSSTTEVQG